ncbi:hypothetical protein ED312_18185 [Sinomicrobium pectinilyticum]|uniref:DUF6973 domain-containing protein n=1 Tax=Sinomicrobium pectinilyticum TaxID=1084421 RepID=A0A3N0E275_SINP1|nr:hypothetical protein [Sinomicrobium pectinilyticum]RNL81900.1 hypothetical protein ED312_18185 [Sinomicrobium pectinilyticum]
MSLWKLIRHLKFRQILSLVGLFAKHPLMLVPTAKATRKSLRISGDLFPGTHRANGRANAFRHALWNVLIARETLKWNRDREKSLAWAKTITDWHEKFAPNEELAKVMDLHNNAIGRHIFETWPHGKDMSDSNITAHLKEAMMESKKIIVPSDADCSALVHIEGE